MSGSMARRPQVKNPSKPAARKASPQAAAKKPNRPTASASGKTSSARSTPAKAAVAAKSTRAAPVKSAKAQAASKKTQGSGAKSASSSKVTAKSAAKSAAKTAARPSRETSTAQAARKTTSRSTRQTVAKTAAKTAAKTVATKPPVKTAAKPVVKKAAPPAKPKSAAGSTPKAAAPAPLKAGPQAAVKTMAKTAAKATAPAPLARGAVAVQAQSAPVVAKAPVTQPPAASPSDQPIRSTRPSARLAALTVPSLPPAVASTAAKSSYLHTMSPTIAPAPTVSVKKDPKLANNWKTKPLDALTDADVLAMPDSEYMNDVQLAFFRRKLVLLKQDILNSAGETTEHLREETVVVPDPADRATIEEEHALELRTRDRERKLLKKIEQSIARIDAEDYGYCDETGEPIGVGRLLARPTATLSLEAQQRRELKQKMFGD